MEGGVRMENGKENAENHLSLGLGYQQSLPRAPEPLRKIVAVSSIGAGQNFGWALQLALLTPYVQLLGIPHKWASYIWLCSPISGMVVQPLAGHYSDSCTSRFGRRRPFIAAAAALVTLAIILISFAADIGHLAGDLLGDGSKPRAIVIFVVGFWILDVGNNLLLSPSRAFLADLSGDDERKIRNANALFAFFSYIGSVLGNAAGSYSHLHNLFPFTLTEACDINCANLKSCFYIYITLFLTLTLTALCTVRELPFSRSETGADEKKKDETVSLLVDLFGALKMFPKSTWILLLTYGLASLAWYSFVFYDTDWMGRVVYGGKVGEKLYDDGVRAGSLGLMLFSVVAAATSLAVMFLVRNIRAGNWLWGGSNIFLSVSYAMTVWITKAAESKRRHATAVAAGGPDLGVKVAALSLFTAFAIPRAVSSPVSCNFQHWHYNLKT
ncbi:general substrate transporter [Sarracenia purpurea var. burkii]